MKRNEAEEIKEEAFHTSSQQLTTPFLSDQKEEEKSNTPIISAITSLDRFYEDTLNLPPLMKKKEAFRIIAATSVAAMVSGIVYFFSAQQAGERYTAVTSNSGWFFMRITPYCCALTNALFNWEALLDIAGSQKSLTQSLLAAYYAFTQHPIREVAFILAALASTIPYWYIDLSSSRTYNMLTTLSSIINFFVLYDGVKVLYETQNHPKLQKCKLHCLLVFGRSWSTAEKINEIQNKIEWIEVKIVLIAALQKHYQTFCWAGKEERRNYIENFRNSSSEGNKLNSLLNFLISNEHLDPTEVIYTSYFLLFLKFIVLGSLGLLRNFGRLVLAWTAGTKLHLSVGVLCVLFNLIPNLGFSIKSICGFGLLEFLSEVISGRTLYTRHLFPYLFGAIIIFIRLNYLLSGFSGDQLNYTGAIDCHANQKTAFIIGILSNIASALVINGPQCECLLNRLTETMVLWQGGLEDKQQTHFQTKFRTFLEELYRAPPEEVKNLARNPSARKTLTTFFQDKGVNSPMLSEILEPLNPSPGRY